MAVERTILRQREKQHIQNPAGLEESKCSEHCFGGGEGGGRSHKSSSHVEDPVCILKNFRNLEFKSRKDKIRLVI